MVSSLLLLSCILDSQESNADVQLFDGRLTPFATSTSLYKLVRVLLITPLPDVSDIAAFFFNLEVPHYPWVCLGTVVVHW